MYTIRQPLGVVALIAPWNFPIAIPTWKIAPALVSGNTVVFKPASQAPLTSLRARARSSSEAGHPEGRPQPRHRLGLRPSARRSSRTRRCAPISFTGSDGVGKGIAADRRRAPGARPARDGRQEPDHRAGRRRPRRRRRLRAERRVLLDRPALHRDQPRDRREGRSSRPFLERLVARAEKLKIGDPRDPSTELGPAIDEKQLEDDAALSRHGQAGRRDAGPRRRAPVDGAARARLVQPAGDHDRRRVRVEAGPGGSVRPAARHHRGQGLRATRSRSPTTSRFGLSASICTTNISRALEYVERAEAGMVMVNLPSAGVEYHIPFGGMKDSSSGWREQGPAATQFFTESKTVYMKYSISSGEWSGETSGMVAGSAMYAETATSSEVSPDHSPDEASTGLRWRTRVRGRWSRSRARC